MRLERPPETRSKASGGSAPGTLAANQPSTPARSIPSGVFVPIASSPIAAKHMAESDTDRALLIDFGGVLTTPVWDSFAAFCLQKGLDEGAVKRLFREDPEALADLRALETGAIPEQEFERRFGARLGLDDSSQLIDSLFAGMVPVEAMTGAVRSAHAAGIPTGLVSNSWSVSHYDRALLAELFDTVVISAEVRLHKPQPEIYLLAAERVERAPQACLFVDDLRENCEGAAAVGMVPVLHREPAETIPMLERLLGNGAALRTAGGRATSRAPDQPAAIRRRRSGRGRRPAAGSAPGARRGSPWRG